MEVKRTGRIEYVEPNNLESLNNEIPHKYEDYTMYVDLLVRVPSRDFIKGGGDNGYILNYSTLDGTLSFMNGTNGNLTTNYTDISLNKMPENNTSECVGIESINITYDQHMVPVINARFIDIRGGSFFSPQEKYYIQSLQDGNYNVGQQYGSSFMRAIFSIPSPIFEFRVKGFYGKPVSFKMDRNSIKVNFNTDTGNFEVDISFIGYMYGIYADFPMSYAVIAPYIKEYGENYWEDKKKTKFRYCGSELPMYTFYEFKSLLEGLEKSGTDDEGLDNAADECEEEFEKYGIIQKIIKEYNESISFLSEIYSGGVGKSFYRTLEVGIPIGPDSDFNYNIAIISNIKNDEFNSSDKNGILLQNSLKELYRMISDYRTNIDKDYDIASFMREKYDDFIIQKNNSNNYKIFDFNEYEIGGIEDKENLVKINYNEGRVKHLDCTVKEGNIFIKYNTNVFTINDFFTSNEDLIKDIKDYIFSSNITSFNIILLNDGNFLGNNNSESDKSNETYKNLDFQIKTGNNEKILEAIGFPPTVENYFRMTFAHMETFIQIFYQYLDIIVNDHLSGKRTVGNINVFNAQGIESDLPFEITNNKDNLIPPFPIFFKSKTVDNVKRNEYIRPGEFLGNGIFFNSENFIEIDLVNRIYDAITNTEEISEEAKNNVINRVPVSNNSTTTSYFNFIPVTPFDIINANNGNPYDGLLDGININNKDILLKNVFTFLYFRLFSILVNSNESAKLILDSDSVKGTSCGRTIGMLEAINFFYAMPNPNRTLKDFLDEMRIDRNEKDRFASKAFNEYILLKTDDQVWASNRVWSIHPFEKLTKDKEKFYKLIHMGKDDLYNFSFFPMSFKNFSELGKTTNDDIKENKNHNWVCLNKEYSFGTDEQKENGIFISDKNYIESLYEDMESGKFDKIIDSKVLNFSKLKDKEKYYFGNLSNIMKKIRKSFSILDKIMPCDVVLNKDWKISPEEYAPPIVSLYKKNGIRYENNSSIFFSEIMEKNADNIYARAYLFIMALPINTFILYEKQRKKTYKFSNEYIRSKSDLLFEGAFWWRYNNMIDYRWVEPVKVLSDGSDTEIEKETILKDDNTIGLNIFFRKGAGRYMPKINTEGYTISRQKSMAKYFIDWVDTEYKIIENALSLNYSDNAYSTSGPEYGLVKNDIKLAFADNKNLSNIVSFKGKEYVKAITSLFYEVDIFIEKERIPNKLNDGFSINFLDYVTMAFSSFINALTTIYKTRNVIEITDYDFNAKSAEMDMKMSIYLSLKKLYERHFSIDNRERWILNTTDYSVHNKNSDFDNFFFIDTYYNDIRDKVFLNTNYVSEQLDGLICGTDKENNKEIEKAKINTYTVEKFLSLISEKSGMALIAFPIGNAMVSSSKDIKFRKKEEGGYDDNNILDMFRPMAEANIFEASNSFACIYRDAPSEYLNIEDIDGKYKFKQDSFDISDITGDFSPTMPDALRDDNGYKIPAFGVTYGKQNQSYFNRISFNMDSFKDTEASIDAKLHIANKSNEGPREMNMMGQDIYSIYSNYGYLVEVEGMGNMQIMPGMMFQLNNIPMYRGTYMIYKVTHSISPGNITTTFTGGRMKRYSNPLVDGSTLTIYPKHSEWFERGYEKTLKDFEDDVIYEGDNMIPKITMSDLLKSNTGKSLNVANAPNEIEQNNLRALTNDVIIPIHKVWYDKNFNAKIKITSCFRNEYLNGKVGGSNTSAHRSGNAVDLLVSSEYYNDFLSEVKKYFEKHSFDQIIEEYDGVSKWVHIGLKNSEGAQRREFFRMYGKKKSKKVILPFNG